MAWGYWRVPLPDVDRVVVLEAYLVHLLIRVRFYMTR